MTFLPSHDPTSSSPTAAAASPPRPAWWLKRFLARLGPGLITGASDDDPSGIVTYAAAGAAFGYATLWTALITFPLMAAVQYVCAKVGLVSGRGLGAALRQAYGRKLLLPVVMVLLIANTINAGVDVGAVAAGIDLLAPVPVPVAVVVVAVLILALQLWGSYRLIGRIFKWLTLALFAYVVSSLLAGPDVAAVLYGTFVPTLRLDADFLATLVAILGTTISPYLFFWQASQEVEEEKEAGRKRLAARRGATDAELRDAAWDVNTGMFVSNLVMYFIILGTAATLHGSERTEIASAAQAAQALRPLAGPWAEALFALGLIGSGLLAVPVLTGSSAYAVCDALGWRQGLNEKLGRAKGFYAVIVGSTLVGTLINFVGLDPMKALVWTAVLNGLLAPPLLVVIMLLSNNRAVMGDRVNGRAVNVLGWAATVAMAVAAVGLVWAWVWG